MSFKGGKAFDRNIVYLIEKRKASQKETKTDTFPQKLILSKWRKD